MSEWSPLDLSPECWWDASDTSTLFTTTGGGTNTTDGGAVQRWEDKSGNGNHFLNSANNPDHRDESFNGLTSLEFNGTTDHMNVLTPTGLLAADDKTIVAVFDGTSGGTYDFALATRVNAGGVDNSNRGYYLRQYDTAGANYSHMSGGTAEVNPSYTFGRTRHILVVTTTATSGGNPTGATIYTDGEQRTLTTDTLTDSLTSELASGYTTIGRQSATYAGGLVGEVIMFTSVLSDANRQKLEGHLSYKWGIPLVAGHPYKNKIDGSPLSGGAARGVL